MSSSHVTQCGAFLTSFVFLLALVALLIPRTVCAESLLLLYKADTSSTTTTWHETIRPNAKQPTVLGLNGNGDLVVKYGAINVVLAYTPPVEFHKQQEPIRLAMAINQETPAPSGISVRFNFTF